MDEEWLSIKGFPAYQVSNQGRVRRGRLGRNGVFHYLVLKPTVRQYKQIQLSQKGNKKYAYVHRLVLETFRPTENMHNKTVRFLDGNSVNCFLSNLVWVPDWRKKLNYKLAEEIRRLRRESTLTYEDIADRYDVTTSTIGEICRNESWTRP